MPRPLLPRNVYLKPCATYFKPAGVRMVDLEETVLTVDEFEAIRLKDIEGLDEIKAAKKMNISQPTFNRIIKQARKKMADAIVNGKAIKIEGGSFRLVGARQRRRNSQVLSLSGGNKMRIAVSSMGKTLESEVAGVFGRCTYFLIIEDGKIEELIENTSANQLGGAGISTAQLVAEKNVDAVITGNIGPRALDVFNQFGIKVYIGKGLIKEVVEKFEKNELKCVGKQ